MNKSYRNNKKIIRKRLGEVSTQIFLTNLVGLKILFIKIIR